MRESPCGWQRLHRYRLDIRLRNAQEYLSSDKGDGYMREISANASPFLCEVSYAVLVERANSLAISNVLKIHTNSLYSTPSCRCLSEGSRQCLKVDPLRNIGCRANIVRFPQANQARVLSGIPVHGPLPTMQQCFHSTTLDALLATMRPHRLPKLSCNPPIAMLARFLICSGCFQRTCQ